MVCEGIPGLTRPVTSAKDAEHRVYVVGRKGAYHEKYDRAAGSMGPREEYGMNADNNEDADEVLKKYAVSMQLLQQNMQLQQQLQQQQMVISQL